MKNYARVLALGVGICLLLFVVGNVCPLEHIFGIPCPGCHMFTALYWLLFRGDVATALFFHPAVLVFVGYMVCCGILYLRYRQAMMTKKSFQTITIIFLCIFLGVYVYRMIMVFPEYPMEFNSQALLMRMIHLF